MKVTLFMSLLQWFVTFLEKYNGVSKYVHPRLNDLEVIALDACLTGFGAVYGKNVYFFDLNDIMFPPPIFPLFIWKCGTFWLPAAFGGTFGLVLLSIFCVTMKL